MGIFDAAEDGDMRVPAHFVAATFKLALTQERVAPSCLTTPKVVILKASDKDA